MDNKIFFSVINGVETLKYKLLDDESLKTADNCLQKSLSADKMRAICNVHNE
jgi:hypothetical protein